MTATRTPIELSRVPVAIVTPIVLFLLQSHNAWEVNTSVDDLVTITQAAVRLGATTTAANERAVATWSTFWRF